MNRRHFLQHLAAIAATSLWSTHVPRLCAWAQEGLARPHFFIFIFARGGWDPTMVFEPKVGLPAIDVDPAGAVAEVNGITFLDAPTRDWVKTYFQDYGSITCVLNGVNTRSVSHSVGTEIMMTGSAGVNAPDWGTVIATRKGGDLLLPYMALSGPSFSGTLGRGASSGSGFLNLLLGGGYNQVRNPPSATIEREMDAYVERRYAELTRVFMSEGRNGARGEEMSASVSRWRELKRVKDDLGSEFRGLTSLASEGIALATAFERGYAVTGSLSARGSWDSHSNNFAQQSSAFQTTFRDVHAIVTHLQSRNATAGPGTLLDQTTVLVMSEMGRTPKLNSASGKDHWPITSLMAVGGAVRGGRVLGGTDDYQNALKVNYDTGLPDPAGEDITAVNLGAALLQLAGVELTGVISNAVRPFSAFLA